MSVTTDLTMRRDRHPLLSEPVVAAAYAAGVAAHPRLVAIHGPGPVKAHLAARRWQRPVRGVVVMHNGPLTEDQRMWVTLLSGPPGTLLHGLSAASRSGLVGLTPDHLSIVVPGGSRSCRHRQLELPPNWQVSVRWSRRLGQEDVHPTRVPPMTRLPRSIVDAASERVPIRRARVIVLAACQQRLVQPAALWDALSRRGRCRNRAVIAESIADAAGGVDSLPERDFDRIRRDRGLPEPRRQAVLRRRDGRYFLDADWPEYAVRAEVHGIPHSQVRNWDDDLLRQNDITIDGGGLLVFSSFAIRHLAERVGEQLEQMFRRRGWRP